MGDNRATSPKAVETDYLNNLPSNRPNVFKYYPRDDQIGGADRSKYGEWRINYSILEDVQNFFANVLPNLRLCVFKNRLPINDVFFQEILNGTLKGFFYGPNFARQSDCRIRGLVYIKGTDEKCGTIANEYDPRLRGQNFAESFKQDQGLLEAYTDLLMGRTALGHFWRRLFRVEIDPRLFERIDPIAQYIRTLSMDINTLIIAALNDLGMSSGLDALSVLLDLFILFVVRGLVPSHDRFFCDTSIVTLCPPLKSVQPGGPEIIAALIDECPRNVDLTVFKNYDPVSESVAGTVYLDNDYWLDGRLGSRLTGTRANNFCLRLENVIKTWGDYIYFRIGEIHQSCYKNLFFKKFEWIREYYSTILKMDGEEATAYTYKVINNEWGRATAQPLANAQTQLEELVAFIHQDQTIQKILNLVEGAKEAMGVVGQNVAPLGFIFNYYTSLYEAYTSFLVSSACILYSVLVGVTSHVAYRFVILFIKKIILGGIFESTLFAWILSVARVVFFFFMVFCGYFIKAIFINSLVLSWKKYILWLLLLALGSILILIFYEKEDNANEEDTRVEDAFMWVLQRLVVSPIVINILFGFPTLMSMKSLSLLSLGILVYYIWYLTLIFLTLLNLLEDEAFNSPYMRMFPLLLKIKQFRENKTKRNTPVRPGFIDQFSLFGRYPLVQPAVLRLLTKTTTRVKLTAWVLFFFTLAMLSAIIAIFLFATLTVNVEGIVQAPVMGESWLHFYSQYERRVIISTFEV